MDKKLKLSVVVSVYNEEEVLNIFWSELEKNLLSLHLSYEVIFVNDGSTDGSYQILSDMARLNKSIKVVNLSTNFGHEAAMTAGLDHSTGDALVCMDADLQHPPSKLSEMIKKFSDGFEIIAMTRNKNMDASLISRMSSKFFYYILNKFSKAKFENNASDFFLISRRVADILKHDFKERTRFLRGFIQIIGFRKSTLEFVAPKRAGGQSTYSILKLFIHAIKGIATFSNLPLHLGVFTGTIMGLLSIIIGIFSIIIKLSGYVVSGYTTIVVLITFLFSIQFFITGIIGEYLGFIFTESKKRPIYIVRDEINIESKKP